MDAKEARPSSSEKSRLGVSMEAIPPRPWLSEVLCVPLLLVGLPAAVLLDLLS